MVLEEVFGKVYKACEVRPRNLTPRCFSMVPILGSNMSEYILKNAGFYFLVLILL